MADYEWVENLVIKSFSNTALVQVSRFARILKQINGRVLSLRDPELARNLVREVKQTNDPRLKSIFESLLPEFHAMAENAPDGERISSVTGSQHHQQAG